MTLPDDLMSSRSGRRIWRVLALALVAVVVFLHVRWMKETFDASLGGVCGGAYFGYSAKAVARHGLWAMRLTPVQFHLPERLTPFFPYPNHPPLPHIVFSSSYRLFGEDELALRIPSLLGLLLAAAGIAKLGRRLPFDHGPAFAVISFLGCPGIIQYGRMVDAMPLAVAAIIWITELCLRAAEAQGRRFPWLLLGVGTVVCLVDWTTWFAPVGCVLGELAFGDRRRAISLAAVAAIAFVGASLLFGIWLVWSQAGGFETLTHFEVLLRTFTSRKSEVSTATDLAAIGRHVTGMFGWIGVAAGFGCIIALRCGDRARSLLLALGFAGVAPVLVFRHHAAIHEFWVVLAGPFVALSSSAGLGWLWSRWGGRVSGGLARIGRPTLAVAILSVAACGVRDGVVLHGTYRHEWIREEAQVLNRLTNERDVVVFPFETNPIRYYLDCATVPLVRNEATFKVVVDELRVARDAIDRLAIVVPLDEISSFAWVRELAVLSWQPITFLGARCVLVVLDPELLLGRR